MTSTGKLRPSLGLLLGWEEKLFFQGVANLAENSVGAAGNYLYSYMEEVHLQLEGKQPSDWDL